MNTQKIKNMIDDIEDGKSLDEISRYIDKHNDAFYTVKGIKERNIKDIKWFLDNCNLINPDKPFTELKLALKLWLLEAEDSSVKVWMKYFEEIKNK